MKHVKLSFFIYFSHYKQLKYLKSIFFLITFLKHFNLKTYYDIQVSDGYKFGGTNSTVKVQFVGADGSETKWKTLDRSFHDDFEPGAEDKYDFKLLDIGMPCIVNIS